MHLHVLTLNWNGLDKLKKLAPNTFGFEPGLFTNLNETKLQFTWHVRDNGSKDKGVEYLNQFSNTKIYPIAHNRDNFSQGMNYLFNQANPNDDDLILLLNNDVEFGDDVSLKKMIELQAITTTDIVGARLLYKGTNQLQHSGVIFGPRYNNLPYHYRHQEHSSPETEKNKYFQAVTAAVCLVTARAFRQVGGFDEKFIWSFDDVDLAMRIGQLKKDNIAYCGGTLIYHEESASLKKNPVNKMFINQNVAYFRQKWTGKYDTDHEKYLNNPNYRDIYDTRGIYRPGGN